MVQDGAGGMVLRADQNVAVAAIPACLLWLGHIMWCSAIPAINQAHKAALTFMYSFEVDGGCFYFMFNGNGALLHELPLQR